MKNSQHIFIVDDDSNMRFLLKDYLSLQGYAVITFSSGIEVINWMKDSSNRNKPQIVLTDLVMYGMDGIELTRRLLADSPQINVIIYSGMGKNGTIENEVIASGAKDYLTKPFSLAKISNLVKIYNKD